MKKNKSAFMIIILLITTMSFTACGSNAVKESSSTNISKVKPENFSKEISGDKMYSLVQELSKVDDARITGFDGEKKAGDYIISEFKSLGLSVEEQNFPVVAYQCKESELKINTIESKIIDSKALSFSKETPELGITADVVFGGIGNDEDLKKANSKGKLVLIQRGGDTFMTKTERADSYGAKGVIFYDKDSSDIIAATLMKVSSIPAMAISNASAQEIISVLNGSKKVNVTIKVDSSYKDSQSRNIIAHLKSNKKKDVKTLVIGAHYDGVDTPAADDNASGVAVILEAARILKKQNLKCNIDFVAFGAEEIGLVGSKFYIDNLSSDKLKNIIGMINLDMVGSGNSLKLHTMRETSISKIADLAQSFSKGLGYSIERSAMERSDHVNFEQVGIPVAYFEYGPYESYHTDEDNITKIQKDDLINVCNLVISISNEIGKDPELFSK